MAISNTQKIIKCIRSNPNISQTEIHKKTGIPYYIVKYYLEKMEEKGMIEKTIKKLSTESEWIYYKIK